MVLFKEYSASFSHSGALCPPVALIDGRGAHLVCIYRSQVHLARSLSLPVPLVRGGGCGPERRGEAACHAGKSVLSSSAITHAPSFGAAL